MSRLCQCHSRCRHVAPRVDGQLLPPERLLALDGVLGVLVDYADGFDRDGLEIDSACAIHGVRAISNEECSCRGQRWTAREFVATLELELRAARARTKFETGHRPRRLNDELNLAMTG